CRDRRRSHRSQRWRQGLADAVVADVDEDQLGFEREQLKTADHFFLLFLESQRCRRLAAFEGLRDPLQERQLLLVGLALLGGFGLLGLILQLADSIADNFQVRKENLLTELAQFAGQVAAAVAIQDDKQSSRFTKDAKAARVVAPLRG